MSKSSPFGDAFLESLRDGGRKYGILTANQLRNDVILKQLREIPIMGPIGSSSDGDFVFVRTLGK